MTVLLNFPFRRICSKCLPFSGIFRELNVAKCNLGKVKLQANVVSGLLLKRT